jgi:hypothetical protein
MSTHFYVEAGYADVGYSADDIYVDWANRIIFVPKQVTVQVQASPTEIRELDLNDFRLALKDLEDSPEGMPYIDTHRHNTTVTLGGVTFARLIEIINNYTITFEDGQYAVNLVGANSNVGDRVNVNQVSVRSANSAGLVEIATGSGPSAETIADEVRTNLSPELLRIIELALLHGLDPASPLNVTPTSRTAGSVSQVISGNPETSTTVTRT